ncbi:MAG: hypothetical protein M3Q81_00950 [bacterium]|nr:hypothetical protein [bacterium]
MTISTTNQFMIDQLRKRSLQATMETISVSVMSFFVLALLPSLLIRYVYANQQLFEQPKALEYIQLAAFLIGVVHFIYTMVSNLRREAQIRQLSKPTAVSEMNSAPIVKATATSVPSRTRKTTTRRK